MIGRNGAGKSNLFRAIQFVLCEKEYCNLSLKQRKELLNESNGKLSQNAYVEVCFDNTDRRFKLETDEVIIRRFISENKEVCKINGVTKSQRDIVEYLETAGFSRTNPYYIVQQGKVNDLCLKKDSDRLNLLRKLAGTSLFDKKKEDALKALEEETEYEAKVEAELDTLRRKVERLDREKVEVSKWKKKRDEKEILQSLITEKEMKICASRVSKFTDKFDEMEIQASEKKSDMNVLKNKLESIQIEMKELNVKVEGCKLCFSLSYFFS